jgi:hypothetical protein
MPIGPVEYVVIEFPGNQVDPDVIPALKELVANGTIHIIDLLVVKKDAAGTIRWFEVDRLDSNEAKLFETLEGDVDYLLNEQDMHLLAQNLAPNSTAGVVVWENVWATRFAEAVRKAHGRVVAQERVPYAIVQSALDAGQPVSTQH